jgi:hypothetical protein
VPEDYEKVGFRFTELFTHLHLEMEQRRIFYDRALQGEATSPIAAYFADGEPIGVKLFRNREVAPKQCLVKFTRKGFAEDMFKFGRIRISPASYYADGSLIKAVKDLETERIYRILALKEAMSGQTHVVVRGVSLPITNGYIKLHFEVDNYYLYSTCTELDRRMPTDFKADAAVIIKDRARFTALLRKFLAMAKPTWMFAEGPVVYYDPYLDVPRSREQEFYKHLAYSYQKEYRCILRRGVDSHVDEPLQPFFVEIGSLEGFAELVSL